MLSDWVWQDGCTRPSQVAGLSSGKIHAWWADGTKHAKDAYYFSPIDITPARLEANAWKVIKDRSNEDTRENWVAVYEDEGVRVTLDNSCVYIYVKVTGAPPPAGLPSSPLHPRAPADPPLRRTR